MTDGSGLSLSNAVSANHFSTFLVSLAKDSVFSSFKKSLPVAGKTGSLSTMLKGTVAEGRLSAKSGPLTGVRAFAGYAESRSGELLAFSIMANNYGYSGNDMKKKLEKILLLIAEL
jgi:D-alanyl-D-alanine carboxypeptidase/D-alanyl-D-alanine-endopeptidase (penicillin-binding protein 4)